MKNRSWSGYFLSGLVFLFISCTSTLQPSAPTGSEPSSPTILGPEGNAPVPPSKPVEPAPADTGAMRPIEVPGAEPDTIP